MEPNAPPNAIDKIIKISPFKFFILNNKYINII